MTAKTCLIIVGPTAVGKTEVAVQVAKKLQTDIISADSRQCFRELNIGVAKPSPLQLQAVKHHFINSHSIHQEVNVAVFEKYALNAVHDIFLQHNIAVMTGGTGLYIKAFCEGIDDMPVINPQTRKDIMTGYQNFGLEWLQKQVEIHDPEYFSDGEIKNPQRLMRSLEVKMSTGFSIRSFQSRQQQTRDFNIVKIGLQLPREELYRNIHHRVDEMVASGLVEEAGNLLPFQHINALQTVGYAELFDYFNQKISLEGAIENIKKNTRHYAKRQLTWFTKDLSIEWFSPRDISAIQQKLHDLGLQDE